MRWQCVVWGAHAASRAVIGALANRREWSVRVYSLVSAEDFGEPPKSAREPRALPRSGCPAPRITTSYLDFILNSVANACLHQISQSKHQTFLSRWARLSISREVSEISFHSLRHSAVTLLKAAGVSDFIAREIIGHESAAVSRQVTRIYRRSIRETRCGICRT